MRRKPKPPVGQTLPKSVCVTCAESLEPVYIRLSDMERIFSIKRGTAYRLIEQGKIKSVALRDPGWSRGLRLFELASVRAFLKSREEAPQ